MQEPELSQSVGGEPFLGDAFHGLLPFEHDEIDQAYLEYLKAGLPRGAAPKRVLIVGCGMAGMVSAALLRRAGHDVTIVEANTRVGGRMKTFRNTKSKRHFEDDSLTAEAGAMRIPDEHRLVQHLIDASGLPTQQFFNRSISREDALSKEVVEPSREAGAEVPNPAATGKSFIHVNYRHVERGAYEAGPDVEALGYELEGDENVPAEELLARCIGPLRERVLANPKVEWPKIVAEFGDHSMRGFLRGHCGLSENAIEMIGVLCNLESRMSYSFIQSFLELAIITRQTRFWAIQGGTDRLADRLFEMWGLADVTIFNQSMEALYLHDVSGKVRIKTRIPEYYPETEKIDESNREDLAQREWDEVIVTIPFSCFRLTRVWPHFSHAKHRAIRELHYDSATKILLEFRERFWETRLGIYGGGSTTDLPTRFMYYPSDNMGSAQGGVILASYSWANDARKWDSMSAYDRYCYALDTIAITHAQHEPGEPDYEKRRRAQDEIRRLCVFQPDDYRTKAQRANIVGAATVSWMNNPWAFGEAAIFYPGQLGLLHEAVCRSEWDGRCHFAGEHASLKHAWIEGAIESALRSALLVNENPAPTLAPPA